MVQMFYYENHGKCCRKILNYEGSPNKILLYPDEGWAKSAPITHWVLQRPWWSRTLCKVTEVCGSKRSTARGKIVDLGRGSMCIKGRFKGTSDDPDFRLYLTSHVSNADFRMGYSMTGTLQRGNKKTGQLQLTHFAMIKRKEFYDDYDEDHSK